MKKLVASAPSLETLVSICQRYFYSKSIYIPQGLTSKVWDIFNAMGKIDGFYIEFRKGRYRLISTSNH